MDITNLQSTIEKQVEQSVAVNERESPRVKTTASVGTTASVKNDDVQISESLSQDELQNTVRNINSFVQNMQRGIQFTIHEETGLSVVTVTDKESGEVIRSFPSEDMLAIATHIEESLALPEEASLGLLVSESA